MLDIKFIRKNADLIKKSAHDKHLKIDIDKLLKIDEERVKIIQEMDALRAEQNKLSKTKPSDEIVKKLKKSKTEIADFEKKLSDINETYLDLMIKCRGFGFAGFQARRKSFGIPRILCEK
ncbi:MAG: seryl-tRNA synthetase, nonfunctional [Parcubacteria group bacterium GW2011_GWA2_38_13]|nr:MAG: seryl-tRNA synthetase, nonfunctional [Parcubacteria group bacterium GW2011_GWA2_38_13]